VWAGRATSSASGSTPALPPVPAAANEAVRTVATTTASAGAVTVTMALPA